MHSRLPICCKRQPRRRLADDSGATAIEYGLLAGLIAVAIIVAMSAASGAINQKFTLLAQTLQAGR